jgi:hypothetical protein
MVLRSRREHEWEAWFGSIMSVAETYRGKKVDSTFIIKNISTFFPIMQSLHAVLKARFGNHPAGDWVVFQTTIVDVKLFALAYPWSQWGVSYFLPAAEKNDTYLPPV